MAKAKAKKISFNKTLWTVIGGVAVLITIIVILFIKREQFQKMEQDHVKNLKQSTIYDNITDSKQEVKVTNDEINSLVGDDQLDETEINDEVNEALKDDVDDYEDILE